MPEKSIRAMKPWQRRRYSLSARTARTTMLTCLIISLVALVIGLVFYTIALIRQDIRHAFDIANQASMSAQHGMDGEGLSKQVMEIYRGLSPEEQNQTGTEAYRARFGHLMQKGGTYDNVLHLLSGYLSSDDVFDVYLAMYDTEASRMVFIVDPDEENRLYPGEWEPVTRESMEKYITWDGSGMLYDIENTKLYGWLCTAGVPLRDDAGEVFAFLLVDVTVKNVLNGIKGYLFQTTLALLIVTIIIAWILARHMKKAIVDPVNSIAQAAQSYVTDKRGGIKDTDHFAVLNIRTGDEIENLSLVMADMEQDLLQYEDDLTRVTMEKERISTELSLATKIQAAMLPRKFPAYPERKEFDIYASMTPAKEVGGDFYDFFLIDNDHLCVIMADVSGKGIPAALFMMASKIILQSAAMLGQSAEDILRKTNEAICSNNPEDMFVTVWLGILEISTGKLTAANAGHEYPILRQNGKDFERYKDPHGLAVGAMTDMPYRSYELMLQPGAKLFVYTDGVVEATNRRNALYGTDRLLDTLRGVQDKTPKDILEAVGQDVTDFTGDAPQFDDVTMLCLHYFGSQASRDEAPTETA